MNWKRRVPLFLDPGIEISDVAIETPDLIEVLPQQKPMMSGHAAQQRLVQLPRIPCSRPQAAGRGGPCSPVTIASSIAPPDLSNASVATEASLA